jgi:hypothetical protein
MLDLLEGVEPTPVGWGYAISENGDAEKTQEERDVAVEAILKRSLAKLNRLPVLQKTLSDLVYKTKAEKIVESARDNLMPPEDLGKVHLVRKPKGCTLAPVGLFAEDGKLHVDAEIYAAMDSTNQGVFFLHEGIYTFLRGETARHKDSEYTRKTVADLASNALHFNDAFFSNQETLLRQNAPIPTHVTPASSRIQFQGIGTIDISGRVVDGNGAGVLLDRAKDNRICVRADFRTPDNRILGARDCPKVITGRDGRFSITAVLDLGRKYPATARFELLRVEMKIGVMRTGYDQPFNDKALGVITDFDRTSGDTEVEFMLD